MKVSELRDMSADELKGKVSELRRELFNLRFRSAAGEVENPMRIRTVRKDIARALTVINEKEAVR